jgi:hypothetical protein
MGLCLAALFAGCGSDSDSDSSGSDSGSGSVPTQPATVTSASAANEFISCFKQPGFEAVHPDAGNESLFAVSAKKNGYAVSPVNIAKDEPGAIGDAYLVFFDNPEAAAKALEELGTTGTGDVPPLQQGAAVVGYLDESSRESYEAAIKSCL